MIFKKYIVIDGNPILFGSNLIHAEVAGEKRKSVESAGFVYLEYTEGNLEVICMGESTSLKVASRGEIDASLIYNLLN